MKKLIILSLIAISPIINAQALVSTIDLTNKRNEVARDIAYNAEVQTFGARGAVQVSQAMDQAQVKYSQLLVAQNEEIIELLKQILNKPKTK